MKTNEATLTMGKVYALDITRDLVIPEVLNGIFRPRIIYKGKNERAVNKIEEERIIEVRLSNHEFIGGRSLVEFFDFLGSSVPNYLAKMFLTDNSFKVYLDTIFIQGSPQIQFIAPSERQYPQLLTELRIGGIE